MKRLLLFFLVLISSATFGQRLVGSKLNAGAPVFYQALQEADVPSNFLRSNATNTLTGSTIFNVTDTFFDINIIGDASMDIGSAHFLQTTMTLGNPVLNGIITMTPTGGNMTISNDDDEELEIYMKGTGGGGTPVHIYTDQPTGTQAAGIKLVDQIGVSAIDLYWESGSSESLTINTLGPDGVAIINREPGLDEVRLDVGITHGLKVTDGRTSKVGLVYAADGYVTTDRSLTDKEYVDDQIDIAGAGYQPLDGDLTAIAGLSTTGVPRRTGLNTWDLDGLVSAALTGTPTAPTAAALTSTTQIATTAFVRAGIPFVTPEDYGAVGDGSTNDATAIQNAVNSGKAVFFGQKNYRVNSGITVPTGAMLYGSGHGSIISTTSNITILSLTARTHIENLTLLGNVSGAAQRGIAIIGPSDWTADKASNKLVNVSLFNLNQYGLYVQFVTGVSSTTHTGAVYAVNLFASQCGTGVMLDTRAEYNTFANYVAYGCTTGLNVVGGNNTFVGGQIVDGTTGVTLGNGSNDGKNVFDGIKISHNTTNISSSSTSGFNQFTDCQAHAGNISLVSSAKIQFIGGSLNATTITVTNTPVTFSNVHFHSTTPTFTITGAPPVCTDCEFSGTVPTNLVLQTLNTATATQYILQQPLTTTGGKPVLRLDGAAHTALTASTEVHDAYINTTRTVQFATGALTTQRAVRIGQPTYGFVGSSTLSNAYSFYVDGAPVAGTNATITNSYAAGFGGNVWTLGKPVFDATVTAGGTTGNQVINKPTGTVNIAAAGTSVTVTNSFCTTSSIVYAVVRTNDSTAVIKNVVPGAGSFVITLNAAATAETSIGFIVFN